MKRNSLATGTLYVTVGSLFFMVSGYLVNIWLGRHLGPRDYGTFGVVQSLWNAANLILTSGLPQAVTKYIAQDDSHSDSILRAGLIVQLLSSLSMTLGFFVLAPYISSLLHDQSLTPYIRLSSLIFLPYSLYALFFAYYSGLHQFGRQTYLNIFYSVAKMVAAVSLAYLFRINGIFIGYALAPLVTLFAGFHFPVVSAKFSPKPLLIFSLPIIALTVFSTLAQSVDLFFVKSLMPSKLDTGYYAAIQNIACIPYFALSAFSVVLFPSISRHLNSDFAYVREIITKSSRILLLLLFPMVVLISAASPLLIRILYSSLYLPAAAPLSILVFGFGFFTIARTLMNILNGAHQPYKSVLASAAGVVISSVLCFILIPRYGLSGAAVSTTIGAFISAFISYLYVYRLFDHSVTPGSLFNITFVCLVIYLLAAYTPISTDFRPFYFLLLALIYLPLLIMVGEITSDEKRLVVNYFNRYLHLL
ncbi:MAG TPA: flippase [Patescibacteria group bacterium]